MLLAVDTSTRMVGLALYNGVQVLYELAWISNDFHTVELAPAVAALLERSGTHVSALRAVAVATGPGSFTGLRIGLALAKGLALVRHIPLIGIPTLDVLAASQPLVDLPMAAVLRAGRGRLAVGWYTASSGAWKSSAPVEVLTPQDLSQRIRKPTLVCGELNEEERRRLARKRKNVHLASPAQSLRRPGFLAELGWQRLENEQFDDPVTLSPFYLHYNDSIPE
jgi:tRNA threonylcarbamoyladenosine biosynthesis protein TsaB